MNINNYNITKEIELNNLIQFSDWYRNIHGWLSTIVCIFGIPCNLLNILVLTRPNMISSPTNLILTALALSDLFTMMSSLPNSVYFYLLNDPNKLESHERDTFFWITYQMLHVAVSVTTHCISIWLTVYLAFFRYIFLLTATPSSKTTNNTSHQNKTNKNYSNTINNNNNNQKKSKNQMLISLRNRILNSSQNCFKHCRTYNFTVISIISIAIFCILFCVPSYLYPAIREKDFFDSLTNQTYKIYHINRSDLEIVSNGKVYQIMFYSQAIFAKFIPCFLLVTFTSLLISSLIVINKNNKKLNTNYGARARTKSKKQDKSNDNLKSKSRTKRLREYFSFGKDEQDHLVEKQEISNHTKVLNGHKNNHFLSSNKNGLVKLLNNSNKNENENNDLNKKYLNDDNLINHSQVNNQTENNKEVKTPASPISIMSKSNNNNKKQKQAKSSKAKENLRTTLMLVIVCVLFLITEFPQSILLFLSIVIDNFYNDVYMPLGDIMDIFALINNSINFVLYCIMSRAFRNTFYSIVSSYCCCCLSKLFEQSTSDTAGVVSTIRNKQYNELSVINNNVNSTIKKSNNTRQQEQ